MLTAILSAISLFMAAAVLYFFIAPKPTILLLRKMMSGDGVLKYPVECREEDLAVDVQMDLKYPSAHGRNYYDLYLPKNAKRKSPVIIWIHGGGFIAGGKGSTRNWGKLFADAGYAVAAVDYEYAPEIIYPGQTGQIQEFVRELKRRALEGLPIDMNRVYLAGDSAGAYIAAQCGLLAANADFANKIGVKSELSRDELKAMLLYCGPYNIERIFKTDSKMARFIIGKIGWALFGTPRWRKCPMLKTITVKDYVTSDFPPSFITDGNKGSFEMQGRELAGKLKSIGVMTSELFFDKSEGEVGHVYQYDLSCRAGYESYQRTMEFLAQVENADTVEYKK